MYYILYNPLSNGGTCIAKADKIKEKLTSENKEVVRAGCYTCIRARQRRRS